MATKRGPKRPEDRLPAGAPSALTPDVHRRFIDFIKGGCFPDTAASACGLSKQTYMKWMREGGKAQRLIAQDSSVKLRANEQAQLAFVNDVHAAMAEAEVRDTLAIGKATIDRKVEGKSIPLDWRAAAFRLERRDRSRWALMKADAGMSITAPNSALLGDDDDDGAGKVDPIEELRARLIAIANKRKRAP